MPHTRTLAALASTSILNSSLTIADPALARNRTRIFIGLLVIFWASIYVTGLFHPALLDDADTIHAEAARDMLVRHSPVTLYIDVGINPPARGVRYLEKPALPYWAVALSYKFFGVSEWSTRLPLALSVLALALYLFVLGRRIYGEPAGFYAGIIILTSFGVYLFTRFFIPDVLVGLWLAISMGCFLRTLEEERPSRAACWGFAIACALNVLTKGLIGVVFPIGIVVIYLLLTRNLRHLLKLRLLSSSIIFLLVAAPWHIAAALDNPSVGNWPKGFLWFYFINEHVNRFLGTRFPKDYDTVPLFLFWALLLVWLLPWSAFLPQAVAQVRSKVSGKLNALTRAGRANLLFLIWALLIYVFFSFSTRQEYYILPIIPALALMTGGWLLRESAAAPGEKIRRAGRISSAVLLAFGVLAFAVTIALVAESKAPAPGTDIAVLLNQHPKDYALSMGHFLDLTPQALGAFRGPLLGTGIFLLVGTFLAFYWRRKLRFLAANTALGVMMIGMLYCAHLGFVIFGPVLSSKQLAIAIEKQFRPGDVVVINGNLENASSLPFYTGIQAHVVGPQNNMWYGSQFPDAPKVYENDYTLQRLWDSPTRVFLWSEADHLPPGLRNPMYSVAQSGGKIIVSNQPERQP